MKFTLVLCALLSFAVFANGFPSALDDSALDYLSAVEDLAISDEQKKCIQDAYKKVLDANPEVQSWLEEIQILSQKVAAEGQKCKQLTGLKQTLCMLKLQITSIGEYRRWAEAMPATAEEVMQELGEAVLGCLKQSAL